MAVIDLLHQSVEKKPDKKAVIAQDGGPVANAPAAAELVEVARRLGHRARGLSGRNLGVSPVG